MIKFVKRTTRTLARMNYRHFHWFLQWKLTTVCDLDCIYCPEIHGHKHPNMDERTDQIIQLKPKYIVLTGGEPTLYPRLDIHLKKIKTRTKAICRLTTNGIHLERILACLPYVDVVLISVDGRGSINKQNKGIDGRRIFDNIEILADKAKSYGVALATHSVVTRDGLEYIEEAAAAVDRISPEIMIFFNPVLPCTSPLSVASDKRKYETFISLIKAMKKKYRVFTFPHDHAWKREKVICRRQYFRTEISAEGEMYTCFPDRYSDYYASKIYASLEQKAYKKTWSHVAGMARHLYFRKYNPLCYFPCNCEEELEYMFHPPALEDQNVEHNRFLKIFRNRLPLTDQDIEEAAALIRSTFDSGFHEDFLTPFQRKM